MESGVRLDEMAALTVCSGLVQVASECLDGADDVVVLLFGWLVLRALAIAWPNPLTIVLAVLVIAARQLGLGIIVHDCAHHALFEGRVLNDRIRRKGSGDSEATRYLTGQLFAAFGTVLQ